VKETRQAFKIFESILFGHGIFKILMKNIFLKLVYGGFYGVENGSSFLCEGENCQAFFV
jgi:hypothetical protein